MKRRSPYRKRKHQNEEGKTRCLVLSYDGNYYKTVTTKHIGGYDGDRYTKKQVDEHEPAR